MEFAVESSVFINFREEDTEGEAHTKASICRAWSRQIKERSGLRKKDFNSFLQIEGEKLSGSVPDTVEETAMRRLRCWMGWGQTDGSTGLVTKTNLYFFSSAMADV